MNRSHVVWGIPALLTLAPGLAHAGNDDGVLLGNEAAMTGGAVTATVGDGSAAWYNPAGIAQVQRGTVDVNGSAFVLRIGEAGGLLRSTAGTEADGGYVEIVSVPSALTLVRDLGNGVHAAIGVFVPQFSDHTDIVSLEEPIMGGVTQWQLTQTVSRSEYHVGGALGFRLNDRFRIGVGLFAVYRSAFFDVSFGGGAVLDDGSVVGAAAVTARANLEALGMELNAGLQWNPIDELHIGLSVLSPGLNFAARYRVVGLTVAGGPGGLGFAAGDEGELEPAVDLITPTRVRLGVAYAFDGGWVSVEGDVQHPLDRPDVGVDRGLNWGVRAGARFHVDSGVALGFGAFTDLSPERQPEEFGRTRLDFFGGTAGVEVRNEHRLGDDEEAGTIEFSTTVAFRYAVGVGEVAGLRFDTNGAGEGVQAILVSTTVHELSLHLGSALYF